MANMPNKNRKYQLPQQPPRKTFIHRLDMRVALNREMMDRYHEVTDDLGGEGNLSYIQRSLIERALWLEYYCSLQERELAAGAGGFDPAKWTQACSSLQGIYAKIGISRVSKDVTDLATYIKAIEA
jgi:hypothetical protein